MDIQCAEDRRDGMIVFYLLIYFVNSFVNSFCTVSFLFGVNK